MVWVRTLATLTADVQDRADISGFLGRHPPDTIRRYLIDSYQRLREWMTTAGSKRFTGGPYTLGTNGEDLGYGLLLPLASQVAGVYTPLERPNRVEVYADSRWQELEPISLEDLHQWGLSVDTSPRFWVFVGSGIEPTNNETVNGGAFALIIAPKFDTRAYPIRVYASWVLSITNDDATTLTLDGPGFEWLIWDVVIKITAKNNDSQNTYQIAQIERAKQEEMIRGSIRTEQRTVVQRSRVRGRGRGIGSW